MLVFFHPPKMIPTLYREVLLFSIDFIYELQECFHQQLRDWGVPPKLLRPLRCDATWSVLAP